MRILVTGGTGFLGGRVVDRLLRDGQTVSIIDRHASTNPEVICHVGDLRDESLRRNALAGQDAILHLAWDGVPAHAGGDPMLAVSHNLAVGVALLKSCKEAAVPRFVFASSGGTVYGAGYRRPIPETAATNPVSMHGAAKLSFEALLGAFSVATGLESRVARIANAYGPRPHLTKPQGVVEWFLKQIQQDGRVRVWGDGSQVRDFVHVEDVAAALVALVAHEGTSRIFNVGTGKGHSLLEILALMESALGQKIDRIHEPARSYDVEFNVLEVTKARRELGWEAGISLKDGVAGLVRLGNEETKPL